MASGTNSTAAVRVLVIEDDAECALNVEETLRDAGHDVRVACDGDQALAICGLWPPDAIVLDHNLPVMSGEQFLHEIRWNPRLSRVPVLLTSALADLGPIATRLHVRAFLPKPFDGPELLAALRRLLARQTRPHSMLPLRRQG